MLSALCPLSNSAIFTIISLVISSDSYSYTNLFPPSPMLPLLSPILPPIAFIPFHFSFILLPFSPIPFLFYAITGHLSATNTKDGQTLMTAGSPAILTRNGRQLTES